jgi:CO/xanthine dehydrogenase Mo-binding subunit
VIRTLHTDIVEHFQAVLAMHTGSATIPMPSLGSWLSFGLGNAVLRAVEPVRATIAARAARMLKVPSEELIFEGGRIRAKADAGKSLAFADVAKACSDVGDKLREEGWFRASEGRYMYGHTFMAAAADVEVDLDTGETRVLKIVNVLDMGRVLNPVMAYGQIYGGAIQALGYALMEDMTTVDGLPTSPSFAQYMIPTALDIPVEFVSDAIETPYASGPFGAKGIGEAALNCTTPTLLNAVADALGTEVAGIPITQEQVLSALREHRHCRDTMEEVA